MANEVSHHRKTPWFDHALNGVPGVAVVTLKDHPEIQLDQIALLQLSLLGGDAVDHFVVDGGAKAARKAQIALERGLGALPVNQGFGKPIQLPRRDAGRDRFLWLVQNLADNSPRIAHQGNLVLIFDLHLTHLRTLLPDAGSTARRIST